MVSRPHGGRLINRVVRGRRREALLAEARELPKIKVSSDIASDISNIAYGAYSPLTGFLTSDDYEHVLHDMRLSDDTPWTIPIVLDVSRHELNGVKEGDDIALTLKEDIIAVMRVEDIFEWDKSEYAERVYRTKNPAHPGVRRTYGMKELLIGGPIDLLRDLSYKGFKRYSLTPAETRVLFHEKGWKTIVAFQTRNVPHLGHEYVQKAALTFVDGLLIHPLVGWKKRGDYRDEVIVAAYEALIKHYYPRDSVVFSVLWMQMRYAGPREAVHHAIVRKNFGCTHFIVGRDHAGVGSFYGPYEAWDIFTEFPDLGITPFFIRESFYCRKCGGMVNAKICPHGDEYRVKISGTKIRQMIMKGERPPEYMIRPEVAEVVLQFKNPFVE